MSAVADRLTALLAHRRTGDAENDAILDALIGAFAAAMEPLGVIAFGDEDATPPVPAGRALKDPSVAPIWALAHAAQYTGATLPARIAGETEAAWLARAREAAVYPFGIRRGTHEAVRRAIQPFLTGSKTVFIGDFAGSDYGLLVRTRPSETPDPVAVRKALEGSYVSGGQQGAIRAELVLSYVVAEFVTWRETARRWNALPAGVTWNAVTRGDVT